MDLNRTIDIYCERTSAAFWSEPVNAVTNLAFLLAALYGWTLARREDRMDGATAALVALAAAIGVGSFLFHTFGTRWAGMADVIPIQIFSLTFAFFSIRRFFGFSAGATVAIIALLIGAFALIGWMAPPAGFGGSVMYAPALIFLFGLAAALRASRSPAWPGIAFGAATFALSLYLRTIDYEVCADFPLGTHFLWHILNGVLFAALLRTFILHGRRGGEAA